MGGFQGLNQARGQQQGGQLEPQLPDTRQQGFAPSSQNMAMLSGFQVGRWAKGLLDIVLNRSSDCEDLPCCSVKRMLLDSELCCGLSRLEAVSTRSRWCAC
jgi:hypothetical protein